MISYIGNGDYCYANATAMLLTANGENVSPSRIEGLCGVDEDGAGGAGRDTSIARGSIVGYSP